MEDNFLLDFDIMDTPVFAKKSAAPPPPSNEEPMEVARGEHAASLHPPLPDSDPPSISKRPNSSDDRFVPPFPPPSTEGTRPSLEEEPMEQEAASAPSQPGLDTPTPNSFSQTEETAFTGKRSRNRSRAGRLTGRKSGIGPDVPALLAALEDPHLPPPPLPANQPPPPPPPPQQSVDSPHPETDPPPGDFGAAKKSQRNKKPSKSPTTSDRMGEKPKQSVLQDGNGKIDNRGPPSSQRTLGRIPRIQKNKDSTSSDTEFPSHNRQWRVGDKENSRGSMDPDASTQPLSSSSSSASSSTSFSSNLESRTPSGDTPEGKVAGPPSQYTKKPGRQDQVCLDITSYRFIPDDEIRTDILLRKMRGDKEGKVTDGSTSTQVLHQLPTVFSNEVTGIPLENAPGAVSTDVARDKFVSISEFASLETNTAEVFHTITRRDVLVFIIVTRPKGARGKLSWDIPPLSLCQDFSNDFISKAFEGDNWDWTTAYVRSGRWGRVGTIILSSENMEKLSEFRRQISLATYRDAEFDTYSKDVLTAKPDVSILLRASMKTFKTDMIPKVLFARNQEAIAGSLRVLATRFHSAEETSHKGDSKEYWRSIDLKGDEQFMRCLRFIPENQPFLLGFDPVQIRGGLRPQETNQSTPGVKRPWSDFPAPAVPLLRDPRNVFPSTGPPPDENSQRGAAKRGRQSRGARRGGRGRFPRK